MSLVFDIFQGVGVAAAVGVRPFLPTVVTGALAAGGVELSFHDTHLVFLQRPGFLAAMLVAGVLVGLAEWRLRGRDRAVAPLIAAVAVVAGALLCGAAICRGQHPLWIGIVAGVLCAGVGVAATLPLLARVRGRLDAETRTLLPVLTEIGAGLAAALSVVAPPLGVILIAALAWLLVAGRGRGEQKYAGLRILR